MKKTQFIISIVFIGLAAFTACKKSYTCTCTTVVGVGSVNVTHTIDNAYMNDAQKSCNNYQDQANKTLPGGATCRL